MNLTKTLRANILSLAALVALSGAAIGAEATPAKKEDKTNKPAAAPAKQEEKNVAPLDPAAVVVKVNGVAITRAEVDRAKKVLMSQNRMTQPVTPDIAQKVEEAAVSQLIAKELLYQAGRKQEIKDLDKQIQERVSQSKARFPSQEEYLKTLKSMDMTEKDVETFAREDLVINNLIEKDVVAKTTVSDEEAKKFYNDNIDKFKRDETVKASHILIKVEPNASADDKKKAKEKAEAILKQVKGGADFAEVAKKESGCPSAPQGGDLGFFGKGQMVPPFEKAAFAMKPGEVSDVVETQFGYHIIKLTDKRPAETVKFEETKDRIVQFLKQQKVQEGINEYVENLKKAAKIEMAK